MVYRTSPQAGGSEEELDAVFAALAHAGRRAILRHLAEGDEPSAMHTLAAATGMSPQLLNKHAATLERAGLITREPNGREKRVHVHPEPLVDAHHWVTGVTAYWNAQLDALDAYVGSLRATGNDETGS